MKTFIATILVVMAASFALAQNPTNSCGTQAIPEPNEQGLLPPPPLQQMVSIPVKVHIIRSSTGSTNVSYSNIQNEIAIANQRFSGSNLSFTECGVDLFISLTIPRCILSSI